MTDDERFDRALELEMKYRQYRKMLIVERLLQALKNDMTDNERVMSERRISYLQFIINAVYNALYYKN